MRNRRPQTRLDYLTPHEVLEQGSLLPLEVEPNTGLNAAGAAADAAIGKDRRERIPAGKARANNRPGFTRRTR
ncbi:MAG: hypothetical protein WBL23_16650 [Salinisphaera sp.]